MHLKKMTIFFIYHSVEQTQYLFHFRLDFEIKIRGLV